MNEPDIGSGEHSPGQQDVDHDVRSVNGTVPGTTQDGRQYMHQQVEEQAYANQRPDAPPGRVLQSGTHLARILAARQDDGTYEAQVYVRLTREPEVAETYIPSGTFLTEEEAWKAAEERARRALEQHEF
jgi:hypothetical protein